MHILLSILLFITSAFLILLVLIQRGRGGGLAGAFGGLGGQSAFGTKAGDLFTKITIGVATFWIILCAASVKLLNTTGNELLSSDLGGQATNVAPGQPGAATQGGTAPADANAAPAGEGAAPADAKAAPAEGGAAPATDAAAAPATNEAAAPEAAPAATPEKEE